MQAMMLEFPAPIATQPLRLTELPPPLPAGGEIVIEVSYCAVCRTELHLVEGELPLVRLPLIPGHQVVGRVVDSGPRQTRFQPGDRVGLAWLAWACGRCAFCQTGREHLCEAARFHGWHRDGGYAQLVAAAAEFAFPLPAGLPEPEAAVLLGAGVLAYRSLQQCRLTAGARLGIVGFGSVGHLALQLARQQGLEVYVWSRQAAHRTWAEQCGARWTGRPGDPPPAPVDGALFLAADGHLIPEALRHLRRGGTLVLAGTYLSAIPALDYQSHLYYDKHLASVSGASRREIAAFLELAAAAELRPAIRLFPLPEANAALEQLKMGRLQQVPVLAVKPG